MNKTFKTIGYNDILTSLEEYANCSKAKELIRTMKPLLSESALRKSMNDTTQARQMLDTVGAPPLPTMNQIEEYVDKAIVGELLLPEDLEHIGYFLVSVKRLKLYLERGQERQISLAFYSQNLIAADDLSQEIDRSIRCGRVDDYASVKLRDIRKELQLLDDKIKSKAESLMKSYRAYLAESFIVTRSARLCIPIKKEYKAKVDGTVVDKSSTGATLFVEPAAVSKLQSEYELCKLEEDNEERRILYTLADMVAAQEAAFRENMRIICKLDFIFAKGKLSEALDAIEPAINTEYRIKLTGARHPMLKKDECIPLNFEIGGKVRGIVITGPNTGGKTVAIKTVGLLSLMACSGLHVPCRDADICMSSQVLCDIGDGQNIADNLSTFSAHIGTIIDILNRINHESLVILDELGSGTDPAEGMGIAIAILEQLRRSGCLFLATTHYPEVKDFAMRYDEIMNARMAFDRESLKPLYKLEIGKAGESCALYIAKRLGLPNEMLAIAAREAYGEKSSELISELELEETFVHEQLKHFVPKIEKQKPMKKEAVHGECFGRGDSVTIHPEKKIGIVVKPADRQGNVMIQLQKEKILISHKRLKLKVAATELYPADYDFSIVFDTVANRKARHRMTKGYQEELMIYTNEY